MLVQWSVTRKMPPTRLGGRITLRQSVPNRRTMLRLRCNAPDSDNAGMTSSDAALHSGVHRAALSRQRRQPRVQGRNASAAPERWRVCTDRCAGAGYGVPAWGLVRPLAMFITPALRWTLVAGVARLDEKRRRYQCCGGRVRSTRAVAQHAAVARACRFPALPPSHLLTFSLGRFLAFPPSRLVVLPLSRYLSPPPTNTRPYRRTYSHSEYSVSTTATYIVTTPTIPLKIANAFHGAPPHA